MKRIIVFSFIFMLSLFIFQNNVSADNKTEALKNKVDYQINPRKCGRLSGGEAVYGTPTKKYFDAAKSINTKLQSLWDKGQTMKDTYLKDIYSKLAIKSLSYSNKCLYSWTIDALENQMGDWRYHKTKDGRIIVGVDFWSYKDNLTDIDFGTILGPLFQLKNTATKVREYKLASSIQLQTLYTDNKGYITYANNTYKRIYLNDFNKRLNSFCNNQKIYTKEEGISINWNENNIYCVKNRLKSNEAWMDISTFGFNSKGEINKVNLNRRRLSTAN